MSAASSVSGARKKSHRAGVKYRERREARALYRMTSAGMEPLDPEEGQEGYDSEGEGDDGEQDEEQDERHSEPDAPSLTYDSDEHEEEHEEPEAPMELFKPDEIREADGSKLDLNGGEDTLVYEAKVEAGAGIGVYEEKVDTEAEIGTNEEKVQAETEMGQKQIEIEEVVKERILDSSPPVAVEEKEVSTPKPNLVLTPPKKHPIKLLSLMRPKVL